MNPDPEINQLKKLLEQKLKLKLLKLINRILVHHLLLNLLQNN